MQGIQRERWRVRGAVEDGRRFSDGDVFGNVGRRFTRVGEDGQNKQDQPRQHKPQPATGRHPEGICDANSTAGMYTALCEEPFSERLLARNVTIISFQHHGDEKRYDGNRRPC